ncbi:Cytochrome oxidase assembly factor 4 [Madurella fahalii]|uniref:Cytochrome oxidase assembly factor 4 n=1 Tax=Madurella fahalii TaxID=1157608 RepID=A0ABQ0GE87_9PEZI
MSKENAQPKPEQRAPAVKPDDDEPDPWDRRIFSTGCADENLKMTDCYYETKDWRACQDELEKFKQCWRARGNNKRTKTKDA